ncbi:MAG: phosphodiesterase, partial [Candidatus Lutacidiplasmatales archaeon]
LWFNVRGRDPQGCLAPAEVPGVRARLVEELGALTGPDGARMPVEFLDPQTRYEQVTGDPPDLMAYFGNLKWRSAGSVGHPELFLKENDTGPDDAVHSYNGVLLIHDPSAEVGRELERQEIRDVAPTLLQLAGIPIPAHIQGRAVAAGVPSLRPAD